MSEEICFGLDIVTPFRNDGQKPARSLMWTYWSPEPRDVLVITRRTKKALWWLWVVLAYSDTGGAVPSSHWTSFSPGVRRIHIRMTVTEQCTSATTLAEVLRKRSCRGVVRRFDRGFTA